MTHRFKTTILGCGSSGGVPRVGGDWGVCDPNEPKNRRTRCSILVEQWKGEAEPPDREKTIILIDTSPDLREQLLKTETEHLDAIFLTHEHADQIHGIDDVRSIAYRMRGQIPTYMDAHTKTHVFQRFKYCFEMPDGRVHPPILALQPLFGEAEILQIDGPGGQITAETLLLSHGPTPSYGFKINERLVYTPDVWSISDATMAQIDQVPIWILDALRYNEHPTHAHADRVLSWLARARTQRGILTNLHIDMDFQTLSNELPGNHEVAFDGMTIIL